MSHYVLTVLSCDLLVLLELQLFYFFEEMQPQFAWKRSFWKQLFFRTKEKSGIIVQLIKMCSVKKQQAQS